LRAFLTFILLACALQIKATPPAQKARKEGAAERIKNDKPAQPSFDSDAINNPATVDPVSPDSAGNAVARAQILLDRFHFSPGQIDGHYGDNLRVAILGFQAAHNLPASGEVDATTWQKLNEDSSLVLVPYTIAPDDVKGPFVQVPKGMDDQAKLQCTCYSSPEEAVGERFHISPDLLKALNPEKNIGNAGEQILVPNVQRQSTVRAARVEVSKSQRTVSAYGDDGKLLAQYPATIGSEHDPLPIGDWKIAVIQQNPWFNYNPELFWDANPKDTKARIPPGPNNPVGVVWMGLSKEHYGIHGTPNPRTIGHTESHGCIRLTNWDAEELSQMAQVGTPAILKE
jgi:lipoprotein-anchoring transpeptidase ErfK/SrfK